MDPSGQPSYEQWRKTRAAWRQKLRSRFSLPFDESAGGARRRHHRGDRAAAARPPCLRPGQGKTTTFAQALIDEGLADSVMIAKALASRHNLPLIDVHTTGIDDASGTIPLHVLERLVALPYALDEHPEGRGRESCQRPRARRAQARLRHQIELAVAPREDIEGEIKRLARAAEAFGARSALEEDEEEFEEVADEDDLEAEDGISDAPLVRLVNSLIFQAAEDGASDMHFEPSKTARSSASGSTA